MHGHNSHVTLEVVRKSLELVLDLVTLPSHTSHRPQPMDVSVFAPFRHSFKRYKDVWVLHNRGKGVGKQVLAMWVFGDLQRALTPENIKARFCAIGIWLIDHHKVDQYLDPTWPFSTAQMLGAQQTRVGVEISAEPKVGSGVQMAIREQLGRNQLHLRRTDTTRMASCLDSTSSKIVQCNTKCPLQLVLLQLILSSQFQEDKLQRTIQLAIQVARNNSSCNG